jgi:translation initiation factor 3 subunit B
MRFPHSHVKRFDFSPCEKYLVTWNDLDPERDNPKDPECIIIWEVATGRKLRGFLGPKHDEKIAWPMFKFQYRDEMVARLVENAISVYTLPDMTLLDKRSMKIPHIKDFQWSPGDSIIAYWQPEVGNNPAKVTLVEMPSRKELRQKAVYSVADIELYWQQNGKYLCCKVSDSHLYIYD